MDDMQSVVFVDDDGNEVALTLIMAFEHENKVYYAMTPDDEDTEEISVVFMQRTGTDDDPVYEPVVDDTLEDTLFEVFDELLDE